MIVFICKILFIVLEYVVCKKKGILHMELRERDKEVLKSLTKIEKRIQSLYSFVLDSFENPELRDKSIETLLTLISKEDELIEALELTRDKLQHIEKIYVERVGLSLDTNLPLGLSSSINKTNYPYYRTIAKMRYVCSKMDDSINHILDSYLLDNELNLLYIAIMRDIERQNDPSFRKSFLEYSQLILIDSPTVEVETLKRKMAPREYVDDCIELQADVVYWSYIKKLKQLEVDIDKSLIEEFMKPKNILDITRASSKYRAPRAGVQFKEIVLELYKYGSIMTDCRTPDFYVKVAYLKMIIAFFDKRSREATYNSFLSSEVISSSKYPWLMDLIKDNIIDLETNFISYIRKIALNPAFKIS